MLVLIYIYNNIMYWRNSRQKPACPSLLLLDGSCHSSQCGSHSGLARSICGQFSATPPQSKDQSGFATVRGGVRQILPATQHAATRFGVESNPGPSRPKPMHYRLHQSVISPARKKTDWIPSAPAFSLSSIFSALTTMYLLFSSDFLVDSYSTNSVSRNIL